MAKQTTHPQDGKSLKTFFIYTIIVLLLIALSLLWKGVLIVQQSRYNDQHFVLAIAQNEKVKQLIIFDPDDPSVAVLHITDAALSLDSFSRQTGIAVDGHIDIKNNSSSILTDDAAETLFHVAIPYPSVKKDVTVYDLIRLGLFAKNLPPNKEVIKQISSSDITTTANLADSLQGLLSDNTIATENVSVQIINASDISGMGQRLENLLLREGANVVSVTTADEDQQQSQIKYFDHDTYTLEKIHKQLGFPVSKLENETIAEIVIIIGKDSKDTKLF